MRRQDRLWIIFLIILDQGTKNWIYNNLLPFSKHYISSFCNLTLVFNTGVAFSLFSQTGSWHLSFFIIMNTILVFYLCYCHWRSGEFYYNLLIAGAIGNILDRVFKGAVVDFIDIHYYKYHWPVFNIADFLICIGGLLFFLNLRKQ